MRNDQDEKRSFVENKPQYGNEALRRVYTVALRVKCEGIELSEQGIQSRHLPEIDLQTSITYQFEFDSLQFMAFVSGVEMEFGITFRDDITYEELDSPESLMKEIENAVSGSTNLA